MRHAIGFAVAVLFANVALAAELPSAASVREKVQRPATSPASQPVDPSAEMRKDIRALREKIAAMPPAEAAAAWLALVDRYQPMPSNDFSPLTFDDVVSALPSPAAWPELSKAVRARGKADQKDPIREAALQILVDTLNSDAAAQTKDADALRQLLGTEGIGAPFALALDEAMKMQTPEKMVQDFENQITADAGESFGRELNVPDLVTLAGPENAEQLLRRAVVLPGVMLEVSLGEETKRLARKVAVDEIADLKTPQWRLARSLDGVALYEALERKFPPTTQPANAHPKAENRRAELDRAKQEATQFYLLGLVIKGRPDDALALAKKLPNEQVEFSYNALRELERMGHVEPVHAYLHRLLSENPDLPLWESYVSMSARLGKTEPMLELARKSAARENLDPAAKVRINRQLTRALFAADKMDEGVDLLRSTLSEAKAGSSDDFTAALQLIELGRLLNRPELADEGIAAAKKVINPAAAPDQKGNSDSERAPHARQLAAALEKLNRAPDAVNVIVDTLATLKQASPSSSNYERQNTRGPGVELLGIYHRAGRHADVLELLKTLPVWGDKDLAGFFTDRDSRETPVGYIAAAALAETGKADDAKKILAAMLNEQGGHDASFQLLIKLYGDAAPARLDELFARDQFEERPLIWTGSLLLSQNKLDEAEKTIRQAIAIDPSDGEQGKGDRMRVYAVLADIMEKKGDAEAAKMFRGAVKAIRTAEDADDWWEAGLLTRAVKQYEQALTYFQDAYCIQSRIALRMAEMGFTEKAVAHYEKAYALMPDSFGRMESHCFGCEGAFEGPTPRKIAERVFNRLLEKNPKKPQIHYLLGYLREQEGRHREAVEPMRQAVKLDADYLNAWKHLRQLGDSVFLPQADRDAAALNLLRLDPRGKHVDTDLQDVRDLKALWTVATAAAKVQTPRPTSLMPVAPPPPDLSQIEFMAEQIRNSEPAELPVSSPGRALTQTKIVAAVIQIIDRN
jgi:tetratricopeptide (TPR) repeat protein